MSEAKSRVRELLDRLPDGCSLEEILYHLYVAKKVEEGLDDAANGRTVSHDQVADDLRRKWQVGRAG